VSALLLGACTIGAFAVASLAPAAQPAHAAEQVVLENPPEEAGICSESGFLGQTFTPQQTGTVQRYGFWVDAEDVAPGSTVAATVSIGWWIADDFLPFDESDVTFTVGDVPTLVMFTPSQAMQLDAGALYGIMMDFDGLDTCPVGLATSGVYTGGFMVLDGQQAIGQEGSSIAFRVEIDVPEPGAEPEPNLPAVPGLTGDPPRTATVGSAYSYQFTVTGNPQPRTTMLSGSVPGLTFSETGLLAGTPTVPGSYPLMLSAENGYGSNATFFLMLEVGVGAEAPTPAPPAANPRPPGPAAQPAAPSRARSGSVGTRALAESGVEPGPAVMAAGAVLLAGGALAGAAMFRRGRRATAGHPDR
jgi:hypothetical protein